MLREFQAGVLVVSALLASQLLRAQDPPPLAHITEIGPRPNPPSEEVARAIGDYGDEKSGVHVYERDGRLEASFGNWNESGARSLVFPGEGSALSLQFKDSTLPRRDYGAEADARARSLIKVDEKLIAAARKAKPPAEQGTFRKPDLVSLPALDPTIKLDIRYATPNNFAGYPVYAQAAAFMQRPAAEAVVRAHRLLKQYGYGIAVHDSYRPWYVTKVFWDATPTEGKIFVADPAEGSRHNRGAAIDLTMYDLATGEIVEMPGRYDEMSTRSYADYFGGTSLQRWRRDLLRYAMEQQGFEVYPYEWWHFDYKDWRQYPILNVDFDSIR